jgi:uncharacterized protein (DUF4415 family)
MANGEDIRRYTAEELEAMILRGESQTDWAAVDAKTEEDLKRDTESDPAWDGIPEDWYKDAVLVPGRKRLVSLRLDDDVLTWFRAQGRLYQTKMNAVLRAYMTQVQGRDNAQQPGGPSPGQF